MKKRLLSLFLAVVASAVFFAGCQKTDDAITYSEEFPEGLNKEFLITKKSGFNFDEADFGKRALMQEEKIMAMFYNGTSKKMAAGYHNNSWADSYLWGYGGAQTMAVAVYRAHGDNAFAKNTLTALSDNIDAYKSWNTTDRLAPSLYDAGAALASGETKRADAEWMALNNAVLKPDAEGRVKVTYYGSNTSGGDPYYDDNIWCIIALLEAGTLLNEPKYVQKAEAAMFYIFTGWDFRQDGGFLWKLNWNSKNTCINGPAVMACNMFYDYYAGESYTGADKETKKAFYLRWSKEIYEWTRSTLMDAADSVYYDNVNVNGTKEMTKFSYNTGTMVSAGVGLYHITEDTKYLEDAKDSARGGYVYFVKRDPNFVEGLDIYPTFTWFNVYLYRGFIDVAKVTGSSVYVDSVKNAYDYAWKNARNYYGLIKMDITGRNTTAKENWQEVDLLHVSANAEVLAMLDNYYKGR